MTGAVNPKVGDSRRSLPSISVAPLRIALDATANTSGGKVYLNELLPRLIEALEEVEWIIYGDITPELAAIATDRRVKFHKVGFPAVNRYFILSTILRLLWRQFVLPLKLLNQRPRVLFTTANFASPLFSLLKVHVILGIHNLAPFHEAGWYQESAMRRLRRWLLRVLTVASAKIAWRCISFSQYSKDILCNHGVSADRIVVIPHGIESSKRRWRGQESNVLLLISHYHAYKNIDVVIRALPTVQAVSRRPIALLVQGFPYDPVYYARMSALVESLGLDGFVTLGKGVASEDLANLYESSRCLVFPSMGENCPITLLEAMSVGIPIVGANCPPIPEMCRDAAEYYDTFDAGKCAEAIVRVVSDTSQSKLQSQAAMFQAETYSWEKTARATVSLIRLALAVTGEGRAF